MEISTAEEYRSVKNQIYLVSIAYLVVRFLHIETAGVSGITLKPGANDLSLIRGALLVILLFNLISGILFLIADYLADSLEKDVKRAETSAPPKPGKPLPGKSIKIMERLVFFRNANYCFTLLAPIIFGFFIFFSGFADIGQLFAIIFKNLGLSGCA